MMSVVIKIRVTITTIPNTDSQMQRVQYQLIKKCPRSVQEVSKKCPRIVQEVSKKCPRSVQELSKKCPRSVQDKLPRYSISFLCFSFSNMMRS